MQIKSYTKKELAIAYAPNITLTAALNRLALWLRSNDALWEALLNSGYHKSQRYFTPGQVELIFAHIGEP